MSNTTMVFIVQNDSRKNYSDAKRYGALKDIFGNVVRDYNTPRMMKHAREALSDWQRGDYLLISGDPALNAVAMVIVAENHGYVDILKWDKQNYEYLPQRWDFDAFDNADNFSTADD